MRSGRVDMAIWRTNGQVLIIPESTTHIKKAWKSTCDGCQSYATGASCP